MVHSQQPSLEDNWQRVGAVTHGRKGIPSIAPQSRLEVGERAAHSPAIVCVHIHHVPHALPVYPKPIHIMPHDPLPMPHVVPILLHHWPPIHPHHLPSPLLPSLLPSCFPCPLPSCLLSHLSPLPSPQPPWNRSQPLFTLRRPCPAPLLLPGRHRMQTRLHGDIPRCIGVVL
ncbi:unnamed protein product [Closterium sp. NIES-53]